MLTHSSLPEWTLLARAFMKHKLPDVELCAPWTAEGDRAGCLSRSAWSLALVSLWRMKCAAKSEITVWIPDYFCNASLAALRHTGAKLVFYPITDEMVPDWFSYRSLADENPPDVFVLVHYFGKPRPATATRDFCKNHGAWLVEDAAHVFRPIKGVGVHGDFVLFSPHKHLPIPDGAILVVKANGPSQLQGEMLQAFGDPSGWHLQLSELQHQMLPWYSDGWGRSYVWLAKRMLQMLGVRRSNQLITPFAEPILPGRNVSPSLGLPSQSGLSKRLLGYLLPKLFVIARKRQRNQLLWDALLLGGGSASDSFKPEMRPKGREWIPYLALFPLPLSKIEDIYSHWLRIGLPVTTWPDLPPEVTLRKEQHVQAWKLRHSHLYLPVHQSICVDAMLAKCPAPNFVELSNTKLILNWDNITREKWSSLLAEVGHSNLLQTWEYGEAKVAQSGWRVKRGVFYCGTEPIALVQVLYKRIAGMLTISRVNRGPLFIKPLTISHKRNVWKELGKLGNLRTGHLLSIAPEEELSGESLVALNTLGFRQFSVRAWESIWIDLGLDHEVLRSQLDGKWRNMLSFSERAALKLEYGNDDDLFDWMMIKYQELMKEKDFNGPSIELLIALRQASENERLIVLRAMHENEAVSGILLVRHGLAATYLLGWNGSKGRTLKANQYLLWQAILTLKQASIAWFDLGGVSEDITPGISAFKQGLNGKPYELVGEYWKW